MKKWFGAAWIGLMVAACSGGGGSSGDGGSTANAITISGSLASSSKGITPQSENSTFALSDLQLYGIAFTNPPTISTVAVSASGSFSLTLSAPSGTPISLVFRDTSNNNQEVGVVKFEDTSSVDLSGNTKKSSTVPLSGAVDLGSLTLSGGEVVVPVSRVASNIGNTTVDTSTSFNPSGVWTVTAATNIPSGYTDPTLTNCRTNGNGTTEACIAAGMKLTLIRLTGNTFTPNTGTCSQSAVNSSPDGGCPVSDGTVGSTAYALSLWQGDDTNSGGVKLCGSKIGFYDDEARAFGHIHLTSSSIPTVGSINNLTFGPFTFGTPSGWTVPSSPYNQWWMSTSATATRDYQACTSVTKTGSNNVSYNFMSCKVSATISGTPTARYSAWLNGNSCVDSTTNQPLFLTNYFWTHSTGSCGSQSNSPVTGVKTNTCTYTGKQVSTGSNISVTCSNWYGQFTDADMTTPDTATWTSSTPTVYISSGAACSSAASSPDGSVLAAYQCFSDYYYASYDKTSVCTRDLRTNWQSVDSAHFVLDTKNSRPEQAIMTNLMTYTSSGQTFTVEDEESKTVSFTNGTAVSFCQIKIVRNVRGTKVSDNEMLMDVSENGVLLNRDTVCLNAANATSTDGNAREIQQSLTANHWLFRLTK